MYFAYSFASVFITFFIRTMAKTKSTTKKTASGKTVQPKKAAKKAVKTAKAAPKKKVAPKKTAVKKVVKKAPAKKANKKGETLMCFLTTACVRYYGLADNGYELNTLRRYRDQFLLSSQAGKVLVQEYYDLSPALVKKIERDHHKKTVYAYIYEQVQCACQKIEANHFRVAQKVYTDMVKTLLQRYSMR